MDKTIKYLVLILIITMVNRSVAQQPDFLKTSIKVNDTSFDFYQTDIDSESVVLIFHDWFGVSDLSFEMMTRLNKVGMDVRILDLYKGKSAKNNQEARLLMNSVDIENSREYIDTMIEKAAKRYDNVFLWGFSLGTQFACMSAIRNNSVIDGLILFYGNVPQQTAELNKMTFPSLMVMGSKDNPDGAINFFNALNKENTYASLFIYPNARHAFAQKLFNGGANYDEAAKETSFRLAFDFLAVNK